MKKQFIIYFFLGLIFVVCIGASFISFADTNRPPVFDFIGNQTANEGELLQFTIHAIDPDGDTLTYSVIGLPRGATFDSVAGVFSWIPDYTQSRKASPLLTFTVTDGNGGDATQTVFITVNNIEPPELIQNPSFDNGIENWYCTCLTNANATIGWDTVNYDTTPGSLQVQCIDNGDTYKDIQLLTNRFNLVKDTTYRLTFKAKSSVSFTIPYIKLNQAVSPWGDNANPFNGLTVAAGGASGDWREYAALFTANANVSDARLTFFLGNALPDGATLNIDTVSLKKVIVYPPSAGELLPNPDFDGGIANWNLYCDSSALAYRYLDATDYDTAPVSYKIQCIDNGNTVNSVQLFTMPFSITAGKSYQLTFKAKCDSIFAIPSIRLMKATSPWTLYAWPYSGLTITNSWQDYSIRFTANTTVNDGRITFFLGNALPDGATCKIDSVSLKEEVGPTSVVTPTQEPTVIPTIIPTPVPLYYWDSFTFGADDWINSAPSTSILATFSSGGKTYPALVATEYGTGKAVYAEGTTFSELYNITNPGNVRQQLFVNSVKWVTGGKLPSQTRILATYGHRELLTYHYGNGIGSNAVMALQEKGYSVDVVFNIPASLTGYDAVIMPGLGWQGTPAYPNPIYWSGDSGHALTANEVSVLLNFIRNGGGLVASTEYGMGASWMSPIGIPMGVSFKQISNISSLVGKRIVEHPIFLKW